LSKTILYQPTSGYRYNSDTLFLWDFISKNKVSGKVLDVGSGSGVLGILLKRDFQKIELHSAEKQQIFQKLTKKNSEINGVENSLFSGDFLETDFQTQFDLIISNPPFYNPSVIQSKNQILNTARYSQHLPIDKFFHKVSKILKERGRFTFCYDVKEFVNLGNELEKNRLKIERIRFVYPKKEKNSSLVMIETRKGSKSALNVEPPLVNFTDEVNEIYKKANTHTISFDN
jgi:tRNA1Val (adenine37-N6)-methyltransferase